MDGLLLNTEDIYTEVTNIVLRDLGRPPLSWHIKAQLQGRTGTAATKIFADWARLPISIDDYVARCRELYVKLFAAAQPLPGVVDLINTLIASSPASCPEDRIEIALATSSNSVNFGIKTAHLGHLFDLFPPERKVLGDDPRIPAGRGKPAPDIYLLALETVNAGRRAKGQTEIKREECLVFEDAVPGVEAGRRAGMRVVWVPHPGLLNECKGREEQILAGLTGEAERDNADMTNMGVVGEIGDGKAELRNTLVGFDYERYGINTGQELGKQ